MTHHAKMRTLYVHRPLLNVGLLYRWFEGQGVPGLYPPEKLHATIAYSRQPLIWPNPSRMHVEIVLKALDVSPKEAGQLQILGDSLALTFESTTLRADFARYINQGADFAFGRYIPHISIAPAAGLDIAQIEPFRGLLQFGAEVQAEVDENWSAA